MTRVLALGSTEDEVDVVNALRRNEWTRAYRPPCLTRFLSSGGHKYEVYELDGIVFLVAMACGMPQRDKPMNRARWHSSCCRVCMMLIRVEIPYATANSRHCDCSIRRIASGLENRLVTAQEPSSTHVTIMCGSVCCNMIATRYSYKVVSTSPSVSASYYIDLKCHCLWLVLSDCSNRGTLERILF